VVLEGWREVESWSLHLRIINFEAELIFQGPIYHANVSSACKCPHFAEIKNDNDNENAM
jgi:hypothetical protein